MGRIAKSPVTAFISHATADRAFGEQHIIQPLHENGIATWYCKDSIRIADKWERQIVDGIKASSMFVLEWHSVKPQVLLHT